MRIVLLACLVGCQVDDQGGAVPEADAEVFRRDVYPVLLADCAFPACHGTHERFFAVFGPGRARLSLDTPVLDPATPDELALSFTRARSMLVSPDGIRRSPLLRKPLAKAAGGAGHGGEDEWGENIYASKQDPNFQALFFWATTGGS
jgi:hypothetical protein